MILLSYPAWQVFSDSNREIQALRGRDRSGRETNTGSLLPVYQLCHHFSFPRLLCRDAPYSGSAKQDSHLQHVKGAVSFQQLQTASLHSNRQIHLHLCHPAPSIKFRQYFNQLYFKVHELLRSF